MGYLTWLCVFSPLYKGNRFNAVSPNFPRPKAWWFTGDPGRFSLLCARGPDAWPEGICEGAWSGRCLIPRKSREFFWGVSNHFNTLRLYIFFVDVFFPAPGKRLIRAHYNPRKLTNFPWKSMVGRCISYWNRPFLGDMLVFGECTYGCALCNIWVFPKIGVRQNGWFTMEISIKIY